MSLLSFLKRARSANSQPHGKRVVYRESDNDIEHRLKQRARRRLIGASLLVIVSIVVLPKILNTTPQRIAFPEIQIYPKRHADKLSTFNPDTSTYSNIVTLSKGEKLVQPSSTLSSEETTALEIGSTTSVIHTQPSGKFFLKAGAFASESRAYNWLVKLKVAKLPASIYHRKTSEGDRYLVRVGPFIDRVATQIAQKKLQTMGLPSIISEGTQ